MYEGGIFWADAKSTAGATCDAGEVVRAVDDDGAVGGIGGLETYRRRQDVQVCTFFSVPMQDNPLLQKTNIEYPHSPVEQYAREKILMRGPCLGLYRMLVIMTRWNGVNPALRSRI